PLAPISSLQGLLPAANAGPLGSEGVPIPAGRPLARAGAPAPGGTVDGISGAAGEQLAFHIHAHLTIFVAGSPRRIPYGVGITPPVEVEPTPRGPVRRRWCCVLLASHPRSRRDHPHRVADRPHIHP